MAKTLRKAIMKRSELESSKYLKNRSQQFKAKKKLLQNV